MTRTSPYTYLPESGDYYDPFLCLTDRCQERRRIRQSKRGSKAESKQLDNEERKLKMELARQEAALQQRFLETSLTQGNTTHPSAGGPVKASINPLMIAVLVLVAGGAIWKFLVPSSAAVQSRTQPQHQPPIPQL